MCTNVFSVYSKFPCSKYIVDLYNFKYAHNFMLVRPFHFCTAVIQKRLICNVLVISDVRPLKLADLLFSTPDTLTQTQANVELEK